MIRVGLVGCGFVSETHMTVYSLIPEAEVVAVADIMPERAKTLARRFDVERMFSNHEDLLALGGLDLVDICTPPSSHAEIAQDAARAECHVLVEKPMARTSKECSDMGKAAEKSGVKLCVCHNLLFHPVVEKLKRIVEVEGLVSLRTFFRTSSSYTERRGRWTTRPEEGGPLWRMGSHAAYVHNEFLGESSEVRVVARKVFAPVEDLFRVLVRSQRGLLGVMDFFWGSREAATTIEIETAEGERVVANLRKDYLERRAIPADGFVQENLLKLLRELKGTFGKRVGYSLKLILRGPKFAQRSHYALISRMIESIRDPKVSPPVPSEDGLAAVELLERIESRAELKEL